MKQAKFNDIKVDINGTCSITNLKENYLSFINNKKYLPYLKQKTKSIILYPEDWKEEIAKIETNSQLIPVKDPTMAFSQFHNEFHLQFNPNITQDGIHPTVIIEKWVKIGESVCIDPYSVIGRDSFNLFSDEKGNLQRLRHIGGVQLGNFVEIGAGTHIDRGTFEDTLIGDYTKIVNNTYIAHNVKIGRNCVIISNITIGGSCEIGDNVWIGMGAQLHEGLKIGNNAFIEMGANVTKDVPDNGRAKTEKSRLGVNR